MYLKCNVFGVRESVRVMYKTKLDFYQSECIGLYTELLLLLLLLLIQTDWYVTVNI